MCGSEDAFPDKKRLHPHAVRVRDDLLQRRNRLNLQGVLIGGDRGLHQSFRDHQHSVLVPAMSNVNVIHFTSLSGSPLRHQMKLLK